MGLVGLLSKRMLYRNKKLALLYLGYKAAKFGYGKIRKRRGNKFRKSSN